MQFQTIEEITDDNMRAYYLNIGSNVARVRKEKGLSQLDLALKIGHKSSSQISGCEICYKNYRFNIEQLIKIATVLEVDICEFFR